MLNYYICWIGTFKKSQPFSKQLVPPGFSLFITVTFFAHLLMHITQLSNTLMHNAIKSEPRKKWLEVTAFNIFQVWVMPGYHLFWFSDSVNLTLYLQFESYCLSSFMNANITCTNTNIIRTSDSIAFCSATAAFGWSFQPKECPCSNLSTLMFYHKKT
jgi:hypothetical protein